MDHEFQDFKLAIAMLVVYWRGNFFQVWYYSHAVSLNILFDFCGFCQRPKLQDQLKKWHEMIMPVEVPPFKGMSNTDSNGVSTHRWMFRITPKVSLKQKPAGNFGGPYQNSGTPKSSILIGFSNINHPFWGTPIFGNTQMSIKKNPNAGILVPRFKVCSLPPWLLTLP